MIDTKFSMMASQAFHIKRSKTESTNQSSSTEERDSNDFIIGLSTDISDADSTLSLDSALFSTATPRIASQTSIRSRFQGTPASMCSPNHGLPSSICSDARDSDSISELSLDQNIVTNQNYLNYHQNTQTPIYYVDGRSVYQSNGSSTNSSSSPRPILDSLAATSGSTRISENSIENTPPRNLKRLSRLFQGVFTNMRGTNH